MVMEPSPGLKRDGDLFLLLFNKRNQYKMLFVIGKNGYIAKRLLTICLSRKIDISVTSSQSSNNDLKLDLSQPEKFDYDLISKSNLIVLLASISSPDVCKNDFEFAYSINVTGTIKFIEEALKKNARILFFSSDVVYGDTKKKVDENAPISPFGKYAVMKNIVENTFSNEKNFKVFRLSYVFSKTDKFFAYLVSCTKNQTFADIFHPFLRSVIYIEDVIEAILNLHENWGDQSTQVFNICGNRLYSRKEIAELYVKKIDPDLKLNIIKPNNDFFKARPEVINVKSLYLRRLLGRDPLTMEQAIQYEFK